MSAVQAAEDFAEEQCRIGTFTDFPSSCPVSAATLARAGFFYTGTGDRVECFSCHVTVEGWQHGDSVIGKHRRISPWCKFANGLNFSSDCVQNAGLFLLHNSNPGRIENCLENATPTHTTEHHADLEPDYLLRTRQVVDMSDTLYPKNHAMSSEEARLMTFQNWPAYCPITPRELASAGLYYTGPEDQVACFCCGGVLKNWEPGDQAWVEHKRHFPKCFFVLGRNFGNVANGSNGIEFRTIPNGPSFPTNPEMVQYEARLKTFEMWVFPVNKEQLAKAGFYRLGNEDDATRCFYCGGGLNAWKPNDDPWEQHAKWFPGCNYVVEEKGQEFVNSIQLRHSPSDSEVEATEDRSSLAKDDAILQNPLVQEALQMGFDLTVIKKSMAKKLQTTGENYKSVEVLVADLVEAQSSRILNKASESTPATEVSIQDMLRRLQEEKQCKICMDRSSCVVFIPCGHLVACQACAEAVDKCPICCSIIQRRQKIFMS
ncbi:E3 ubiquitin-protein ligase XIAP [Microcaecilia unicolor]|uniref:E3 ubiquitin-protein ligase XIAP n=1 Tax=Microcaecilia unicolor TaxID=1415580 RepID=A0A6P7YRY6_9AMPH|nr:E3 ubiquitin-protein ligase XIAP [Microcaecilia unicolor]XP_030066011.1 E3 ubiquitin-protein ligase XIAP [Microcaecilia unicolor]XP_030066012.1 E3 ubiquitin-protein ligase XIAP [Microcaecilia unicolor]